MPTETYSQPLTLTSRVQSQDTITRSSSLQDKKTDLDFKLIKPSNKYVTVSPTLTNTNVRREIDNYDLLGNFQIFKIYLFFKHYFLFIKR